MEAHEIAKLLDQVSEIQAHIDLLEIERAKKLDELMPPEVKKAMDDVHAEIGNKIQISYDSIRDIKETIKTGILELEGRVDGEYLQAIYSRRTSWDGKKLEGFFAAHPEASVDDFKTEKGSVTIRARK